MARKIDPTGEQQYQMTEALRTGRSLSWCMSQVKGVSAGLVQRWLTTGEGDVSIGDEKTACAQFYLAVREVRKEILSEAADAAKPYSASVEVLTPQLQKKLCDLVSAGNYLDVAASACGVPKRVLKRWRMIADRTIQAAEAAERAGLKPEIDPEQDPYVLLFEFAESASAVAESRNISLISSAALESWQAAAWLLERMHPERYSPKRQIAPENENLVKEKEATKAIGARLQKLSVLLAEALVPKQIIDGQAEVVGDGDGSTGEG